MEKKIVQSLLFASAALFSISIGLAGFARPAADLIIMVTGRGSAALLVTALVLFTAFKVTAPRRTG